MNMKLQIIFLSILSFHSDFLPISFMMVMILMEPFLLACIAGAGAGTGSGDGLSGPGRSFECPLCDAVVIELPAMRAHLEEHYPRDSPTCPVSSCAKAFSHPNSVRNHMRMKHAQQWDKMKTLKWSYM